MAISLCRCWISISCVEICFLDEWFRNFLRHFLIVITVCHWEVVAKQILRLASTKWLLFLRYRIIVNRIVEPRPRSPVFGSDKGLSPGLEGVEKSLRQLRSGSSKPCSNEYPLKCVAAIFGIDELQSMHFAKVFGSLSMFDWRKAKVCLVLFGDSPIWVTLPPVILIFGP